MLNHTVKRLVKAIRLDVSIGSDTQRLLTLVLKWGFDGTNWTVYKQKGKNQQAFSESLICTSAVILRLVDKITGEILWCNPKPSSTRFCRPIKIELEKETETFCQREEEQMQNQIDELQPLIIGECTNDFQMILTMIDGNYYGLFFRNFCNQK